MIKYRSNGTGFFKKNKAYSRWRIPSMIHKLLTSGVGLCFALVEGMSLIASYSTRQLEIQAPRRILAPSEDTYVPCQQQSLQYRAGFTGQEIMSLNSFLPKPPFLTGGRNPQRMKNDERLCRSREPHFIIHFPPSTHSNLQHVYTTDEHQGRQVL